MNFQKKEFRLEKLTGIHIFEHNTKVDIDTNWKRFMLAGVENPLEPIAEDLDTRSDRLLDKLIVEENENKPFLFRPEFTIRNIKIPLEGRLDLVKIKPKTTYGDSDNSGYTCDHYYIFLFRQIIQKVLVSVSFVPKKIMCLIPFIFMVREPDLEP